MPAHLHYGDDCLDCYHPGKTPLTFKVFFSGIKRGHLWHSGLPVSPNGYWDLRQVPEHPCRWVLDMISPFDIIYRIGAPTNSIAFSFNVTVGIFRSGFRTGCRTGFTNDYEFPIGNHYYGGSCHVETPAAVADIIKSITPMIDPDPRMELFPIDDEVFVVRYAGKRDATNINIKFDTDLKYWYEHFG